MINALQVLWHLTVLVHVLQYTHTLRKKSNLDQPFFSKTKPPSLKEQDGHTPDFGSCSSTTVLHVFIVYYVLLSLACRTVGL